MLYKNSMTRSVYILGDGLLFDNIIEHMLASLTEIRVIKRNYTGEAALVDDVRGCRPDVVMLSETKRYNSEQILEVLSRMPLPVDLRVIVMSMQHMNIQILDRPAGWTLSRSGVAHTLLEIDEWDELFDLVTGERFGRVDLPS
jgi:hypothetical protein